MHARGPHPGDRHPLDSHVQNSHVQNWRAQDWRLTTAEILYRLPDHPAVLQSFIWQNFDLAPDYPALRRFLAFWRRELEGPLHSVRVATGSPLSRGGWRQADHLLTLH
ncbi:MAG TPA: Usg-like family protein [Acetobacteraceae bacterium]|nr:Usg-like family protein [Acetobacteraceae bacterium]